jgi:tetratricopeptide (TPR) repeat protein
MINCPYCGKLTDPKLDNCPHCGGYMRRSGGGAKGAGPGPGQRQTCPSCHALVQDGDIICVNCGTNLLTGQKISEEKKVVPRKERRPLWIWFALAVVLLGLMLLAAAYVYSQRDAVARAQDLVTVGKVSEATELLTNYVQSNPENAQAQFLLGRLHWANGEFGPAAAAFRAAYQADRSSRNAFMLAALSYALGNDNSRAADVLREMVEVFPGDAEAWYMLGLASGAAGDFNGQVRALEQAVQLEPTEPESKAYLGIARALQGQYPQAAAALGDALAAQPNDPNLKAAQAFVTSLQGQRDSAAALLQEAANSNSPVRGLALTQLGLVQMSKGDFAGAVQHLQQASDADPANEAAKYYRAVALQAMGQTDQAIAILNELSQTGGRFTADAAALTAQAYLDRGDLPKAQEAVNRALSMGAQSAMIYTLQGRVSARANEDNKARDFFKRALEIDPNYPPAYLEYGLFHITKEQSMTEGIEKLERYLQLLGPDERATEGRRIEDLIRQLKQTSGGAPGAVSAATGTVS